MNYYCYSYFTFVNFVIFSCWTIPAQDKLKKLQIDFSSGCQISWFSAQKGFQGVQMCCTAQEWQLEGGSKEFHKPNFRLAKSNLGADFRISDKIRERILKHEREWFYSWLQESCINEASSNFSPALCSHPLHWTVSRCCLGCLAQQIAGPQPKKRGKVLKGIWGGKESEVRPTALQRWVGTNLVFSFSHIVWKPLRRQNQARFSSLSSDNHQTPAPSTWKGAGQALSTSGFTQLLWRVWHPIGFDRAESPASPPDRRAQFVPLDWILPGWAH